MPRLRALMLAAAAAIALSGCTTAAAPHQDPKPLRPITARFLGSVSALSVTAVQFIGPRRGWIGVVGTPYVQGQNVSFSSALLRTSDGGRTWQVVAHTKLPIQAIDFSSPQDGFVLAGAWVDTTTQFTLYRSSDGGDTLTQLSHPQADAGKAVLQFSSPTQGFVVSQNTLDITTDGGHTWRTAAAQPKSGFFGGPMPFAPAFLSASTGFVAWGSRLLRTTDSGQTWHTVYALPGSVNIYGPVAFATPEVGYAAVWASSTAPYQTSSLVLRTDDGGASWRIVSGALPGATAIGTPPPDGAPDELTAWGEDGVAMEEQGDLYISRDGGVTWQSAGSQVGTTMFSDVFTYVPGLGLLADTLDGNLARLGEGGTWKILWPALSVAQADFFTARKGYGLARVDGESRLVRTVDAGRTWRTVRLPATSSPLTQVSFSDARHGWILRGHVALATENGGRTWHALALRSPVSLQLLAGGAVFALTQKDAAQPPVLLATSDGGRHFTRRRVPRQLPSIGGMIRFATPQVGYALSPMALWRTDDGGQHWRYVPMPAGLAGFQRVVALQTDPSGDLWFLAAFDRSGGSITPQGLWILHPDGAWQAVRLPGVYLPFDATEESLGVHSRAEAWLMLPAGGFETKDGGHTWRPVAPTL